MKNLSYKKENSKSLGAALASQDSKNSQNDLKVSSSLNNVITMDLKVVVLKSVRELKIEFCLDCFFELLVFLVEGMGVLFKRGQSQISVKDEEA